jgi:membrane protein DedA with SNARE-associated domain
LGSHSGSSKLRRRAPQLIVIALIVALSVYLAFEIIEDVLVEGTPITSSPLVSALLSFTHDVKSTVSYWGYPGIFALMLLEASSLPVPSEAILPLSGYMVSKGLLDFWLTVLVATTAALVGSLIDYYIGLKGVEVLSKRKILGKTLFSQEQLTTAGRWFDRYGSAVVFLGRFVPGFRTLISFPAGAAKMKLGRFLAYTLAGCLIWNAVLIYIGYYLGVNYTAVAGISHYLIIATLMAFVALVVVYVMYRRRKRSQSAKLT